ncbi:F-box protein [Trifolium repens]|nr:F-box protein [Trifolium repens]
MEKRQRVEWLDLPTELWTMIAKHLILEDNTSFEVFRFRSICKTWRSAHPLPQQTPFAPQVCIPLGRRGKSFLLQTTMYRLEPLLHAPNINQDPSISSSKGWLIMLEDSQSVPLRLLNPFTRSHVSDTPQAHIFSSGTLPKELNFLNFKVVKLLEAFNLLGYADNVLKLVLFPSFPVEGRMVCALFNDSNLCVRKIEDKKWTKIYYQGFHGYHDIIIHKGQLYVIDNQGTILWMNPLSMELVQFTQPLWSRYNGKTKKMVEFDGRFYVVEMHINVGSLPLEAVIKVYKVNEESGRWEVVKNLGDVAFVLGKDSNFSLSAKDYHGIEGNCIYFSYSSPSIICRVFRFSLEDSMLTTPEPFWPCPDLFKKT